METEQVVAFDDIRIPLLDDCGQALQCSALRFLDVFWINNQQFLPPGAIRKRDAHDVITVAGIGGPGAGISDASCRERFDLQSFQFFKRQIFEQRATRRGQVMLHRIGKGEEIAPRAFESVAQCDEFLPTIDRDQPAVLEIALKLFGFDAKIDNIRVAPDKWVERLNVGDGRSVRFPTINLNRSGLAELDGHNAWCWISAKEQRVLLEFHESSNFLSFRAKSRKSLTSLRATGIQRCFDFAQHDKMKTVSPSIVFLSIFLPALAFAQQTPQSLADAELPSLLTIYKDIHTHPELSGHEERTASIVAKELRAAGCQVTEHLGKYENSNLKGYGVVGVMKNGDGPIVLVRTDMDALPVEEETGLPYASKTVAKNDEGKDVHVMHACGHDTHIAAFIGTARVLGKLKDQWHGTIVFVAQPAEEMGTGARALLKDSLYEKFGKPNFALGFHDKADLETGHIGVTEGYTSANVDSVDITVRGVGGHGAYPHKTKDPIVLAAQIINALANHREP